jgi:hypothetical protein
MFWAEALTREVQNLLVPKNAETVETWVQRTAAPSPSEMVSPSFGKTLYRIG